MHDNAPWTPVVQEEIGELLHRHAWLRQTDPWHRQDIDAFIDGFADRHPSRVAELVCALGEYAAKR